MQHRITLPAVLIGLVILIVGVSSLAIAHGVIAGAAPTSTPTPTLTPVPTATPRPTATARPATSTPTETPAPTATTAPSPTATITATRTTTTTALGKRGTTTSNARPLVVVLDPGHGGQMLYGDESGAVSADGTLLEKNLTLATAKAAQRYLEKWGYTVYLTRTTDQRVNWPQRDLNGDGKIDHVDEFDARTLFANRHHADVFVSIHYDGSNDTTMHGTHGYYCPNRPFQHQSERLAALLTAAVSRSVTAAGHPDTNNGIATDVSDLVPQTRADYPWFLVLGPSRRHFITGTAMPGALIESMYLSNPGDAAALARPSIVNAVGRGYAEGIREYFGGRTTSEGAR